MSISNLLTPNNYNLYCNKLTIGNTQLSSDFYKSTNVTNMKINHYNGVAAQSDNIGTVHFTKIGNIVHCRLPILTTVNVQSGAAEGNFLYIWPIPEGYYNSAGQTSDLGVNFLEVPDVNQAEVDVNFRIEPNINNAVSGVVNQPGIAVRTSYNRFNTSQTHWPANTHFALQKEVTFSYLID